MLRASLWLAVCLVATAGEPSPSVRPQLRRAAPTLIAAGRAHEEAAPSDPLRKISDQSRQLALAISRVALIDYHVRGRDQRRPWVLALAHIHPARRLAVFAAALLVGLPLLLRHEWTSDEQCRIVRLATLQLCGAMLKLLGALSVLALAAAAQLLALGRAELEEAKDGELSEELFAAACAAAAYQSEPAERLTELRERGVESRNWRLDSQLSTSTVATFYNWYTQTVWIAFRGTWSLDDWASNLASIVPGEEMQDERFQANLEVARAAQHKYVLFRSIRLTGHSRGGNMADLFGRKLGLRSISINPATWGKVFKTMEPPVESITTRTADLVSIMESFSSHNRQVRFRWPRGATFFLLVCCAIALTRKALHALHDTDASLPPTQLAHLRLYMLWTGMGLLNAMVIGALLYYLVWMHSVLRFTKR